MVSKVLSRSMDGIQDVEHAEGVVTECSKAVCRLGLEGIVSKRITSVYKDSQHHKAQPGGAFASGGRGRAYAAHKWSSTTSDRVCGRRLHTPHAMTPAK